MFLQNGLRLHLTPTSRINLSSGVSLGRYHGSLLDIHGGYGGDLAAWVQHIRLEASVERSSFHGLLLESGLRSQFRMIAPGTATQTNEFYVEPFFGVGLSDAAWR